MTMMALLLVESLAQKKSRFMQIIFKIVELLLLSAGLLYTLAMLKRALPPLYSSPILFVSNLRRLSTSAASFFSAPFSICVLINIMVLLIAAASKFRRNHDDEDIFAAVQFGESLSVSPPPPEEKEIPITTDHDDHMHEGEWKDVFEENDTWKSATGGGGEEDDTWKAAIGGGEKEEEEDTLDATWKAIAGKKGGEKKSDTWEQVKRLDSEVVVPTSPKWKELRKAETFNDAVSLNRRGGLIRRVPSKSLEEFNQQVEAFIKKFNDSMRLQRQESDQRFLDMMMNRTDHHPR